jgi:ABC-type branched-subunit amino acid transport system substrate-binding protein
VLGQSTALSGPLGQLGQDTVAGSKAYFDYINAQGGINGRKIRLITLDDGYDPRRALANVKRLIEEDHVLALFSVLGTPANVAIMPLISEAGVPNLGPFSGSDLVRRPFNRMMFLTSPSYADELDKIVEHMRIRGIERIGVVYQNNAFGKEGLVNLKRIAAERQANVVAAASIENSGADAAAASATLARAKPQAIILITAGAASVRFIKAYDSRVANTQFFALSVMASQAAIKALGPDGVGVVVSQVTPFPFSATCAVVQEYQRVMRQMGIRTFSYSSMAGYVNAKVMVEGLRRAGRNLTRERLIDTLETMGRIDYDGYAIHYTKNSHLAVPYVELTMISRDGRFLR